MQQAASTAILCATLSLLGGCTRSSHAVWPHARVAAVFDKHGRHCDTKRVANVQATLESLTLDDLYHFHMPCLCLPKTLGNTLYGDYAGSFRRNALLLRLAAPVSVPAPWSEVFHGKRPLTTSIIVVKTLTNLERDGTIYFSLPVLKKGRIRDVYNGFGLKGDPFHLTAGECTVSA
jgi:hypothetical protein